MRVKLYVGGVRIEALVHAYQLPDLWDSIPVGADGRNELLEEIRDSRWLGFCHRRNSAVAGYAIGDETEFDVVDIRGEKCLVPYNAAPTVLTRPEAGEESEAKEWAE